MKPAGIKRKRRRKGHIEEIVSAQVQHPMWCSWWEMEEANTAKCGQLSTWVESLSHFYILEGFPNQKLQGGEIRDYFQKVNYIRNELFFNFFVKILFIYF